MDMNPSSTQPSVPQAHLKPRRPRRFRKWIPYLGAILLVGLIGAGLWPKPAPVETTPAITGGLRAVVSEEGRTRLVQRFVVSAPVHGQLRRIPFKAGFEVNGGETVVAVIDPLSPALLDARSRLQAEARRETAVANLEKARAAHAFAASEWQRIKKLFEQRAISPQEREAAEWREASTAKDLIAAEGALKQVEAELAEYPGRTGSQARTNDRPIEIKAPVSGQVLRVFEENARIVSAGTPLLEVGDTRQLEVVIDVLSRDGAAICPGARVELANWGGSAPLEGRVRLVEPSAFTKISALGVEEQRVNVVADLVTPPEKRPSLGDNFRVDAHIVVWEAPRVLKVPSGALFRQDQRWAAYVMSNGRAQLRTVEAGPSSGKETQVLAGIKEGEEVILYPSEAVRDGKRVRRIKI